MQFKKDEHALASIDGRRSFTVILLEDTRPDQLIVYVRTLRSPAARMIHQADLSRAQPVES